MIKRYISNRSIAEDTDDTQAPVDPTDNTNTLGDVFQAIKRAILTVKEEENNDDSLPRLFCKIHERSFFGGPATHRGRSWYHSHKIYP